MAMLKLSTARAGSPVRSIVAGLEDRVKPVVRWGVSQGVARGVMRTAARKGDLQGRMIAAAAAPNSHTFDLDGIFTQIRDAGPVVRGRFAYVTARHAEVKEVLSSNDFRTGIVGNGDFWQRLWEWSSTDIFNPVVPPSLLATEPPDHTRYRKLVTRVFSVRAVEQLRTRTEEIAVDLLDAIDPGGPVDLVEAYCGLLPVTVISEILGVPVSERERILQLGAGAAASLDMGLSWRQFRAVEASLVEFDGWLTDHLDRLRAQPGDNLLSQLIAARDNGGGLSELELRATAGLVLAAGFETTVNLLGNGVALLRQQPDQLRVLQERPELWPNAVDEILRVDPPVLLTGRVADRATEVGGVPIPAGGVVTTVLAGANRDPEVFADPATFDVARGNAREHLSFSAGRHFCLGAALARMEGEVGLRTLLDRYPDLRLLPGAQRRPTRILRGYESLPAALR